ncbi:MULTISPECIES: hypothetical protein [unclassified Paracoccus (in: a-proteobacteria)]|uniref:hypothetical protein n=1 Tax=unclassified Paracoccus (in: a-proteobacteria) TaxID=2688777 RepID=UPI0016026005|nr:MULTISPECIES: hypothetical protein [unclassified Paracoccus (in: a-proteobacteria)]MBB1491571.1 hypothetical protein [Paracoccus sp. MC1854]MBB1497544.1 hypothetical protein [Paracoccus sp. MC1862]QQO43993.1 hypothetical protein JGR78_11330 [Paracoccus sp. MC1862]
MTRVLLAAAMAAALGTPAAAQTDGPPNVVQGHPTNAFLPGFPEEIDGLTRASIQSKPQEGRIAATYHHPDDSRNVQVLLYRLYEGGIAGNVERAAAYMADGDIPMTRATVRSPAGTGMECMGTQVKDVTYALCVAEVRGRALNVQVGEVTGQEVTELDPAVVGGAHALAGEIVDSIAAAPEG